jgi:hypothetical protein
VKCTPTTYAKQLDVMTTPAGIKIWSTDQQLHQQQQEQQLTELLYQLRTLTYPSTAAAAVTALYDHLRDVLDQQDGLQRQLNSQQQREVLEALVPVLQGQCGEAALTAAAPLLCMLSESAVGQGSLQPHLLLLLTVFLQHTDHAATGSLSVALENVAGFAADQQQLEQQHLQPLLQAALQYQDSAVDSSGDEGGFVGSSSCSWRQHSALRLITHLAMREEVQKLLAQQVPWLLQQPVTVQSSVSGGYSVATAGATFKVTRYLATFSEVAAIIVQHAQQLLASVVQVCQVAEQLQCERQWQYKHNAVLADAAATVLALLHHHAARVQLEEQHLCSTVQCLLALCGQLQQHSNTLAQPLKQCIEQLKKLAAMPEGAAVLCTQPCLQELLAVTTAELCRLVQPQQPQLLHVVQEVAAAAAEDQVPPELAPQLIVWLQQQLDMYRQATKQQQEAGGTVAQQARSRDDEEDDDAAAPTVHAWQQQQMACERIAVLVECLEPLAQIEAGRLLLLPHGALLQASAVVVPELGDQVQQMLCSS